MSDGETKKSMDDVLASIRRIVRAEKQPEAEAAVGGGVMVGGGDGPLALTPDMRMGEAAADFVTTPPAGARPDGENSIRAMVRQVMLEELARGEVEEMVRKIIRDELTAGEIGGNISRNVLRLIRSEIDKAGKD